MYDFDEPDYWRQRTVSEHHKDDGLRLRSGYMEEAYYDHDKAAFDARRALRGVKFDTLVGTGLSGSIVVPSLAARLGVKFAIVRKKTDNSHSSLPMEGDLGHRWIFVDDFISSGATRQRVREAIETVCAKYYWSDCEYIGDYLYTREVEYRWVPQREPNFRW